MSRVIDPRIEAFIKNDIEFKKKNKATKNKTQLTHNKDTIHDEFVKLEELLLKDIEEKKEGNGRGVKNLKDYLKHIRALHKHTNKVTHKKLPADSVKRNNKSGFQLPSKITPELAAFIGEDPNTHQSRSDVTRFICKYLKDNNLRYEANMRYLLCDDKLMKLLNYDPLNPQIIDGQPNIMTYFTLQKYLAKHFIKSEKEKSEKKTTSKPKAKKQTKDDEDSDEEKPAKKKATKATKKKEPEPESESEEEEEEEDSDDE